MKPFEKYPYLSDVLLQYFLQMMLRTAKFKKVQAEIHLFGSIKFESMVSK